MKTLRLMMLFMAVATMSVFTSCDKDDDKDNGSTTTEIGGTYTGKISAMNEDSDATATLTKVDEKYSLELTDLNITVAAMGIVVPVGDVTIPNVAISSGKLSGGDKITVTVNMPQGATIPLPPTADVDVTLTSGTVKGNNLKFDLNVFVIMMEMNVPVNFDGNK